MSSFGFSSVLSLALSSALIPAFSEGSFSADIGTASTSVSDCAACSVATVFGIDALIAPSASARFGALDDSGSAVAFVTVGSPCCSFASAITTGSSAAFSKSGRGPRLRGVVFLGRWLAGRRENSDVPLSSVAAVFSLKS